jgi:hypothetical protein
MTASHRVPLILRCLQLACCSLCSCSNTLLQTGLLKKLGKKALTCAFSLFTMSNYHTCTGNCGNLGHACNIEATCVAGACICRLGTTWNGSACKSTAGASATCGTLGYACNSVAQCINGACVCNAGTVWDGKVCAPTSLGGNCGNLGYACSSGKSCSNGACVCNPGTAWDGSKCAASTTG